MQVLLNEYLSSGRGQELPMAGSGNLTKEGIVVATKLLLLQQDNVINKKLHDRECDYPTLQHIYVDSLPWNSMNHPLLDPSRPNPGEIWHSARREANEVKTLLERSDTAASRSLSFQECLQSVALVRSRAFQLSKCLGRQPHCALVPLLDLMNHPSQHAISFYRDDKFLQTPISQATITWDVVASADREIEDNISPSAAFVIHVHSPKGIHVCKGSELWNWYGNGGHVGDPERRSRGILWDSMAHEAFVETYGFDPWSNVLSYNNRRDEIRKQAEEYKMDRIRGAE